MDGAVPRLGKRAVEQMLAGAGAPADDAATEVDQVREALIGPLAQVLGGRADQGWVALVDRAAAVAGWDRDRWAVLRLAVEPERSTDLGATLDALWDLVTELNERRALLT